MLVQDALAAGELVLLEGAQGALLDLDHGTYPFVTSSNPIAGGATTGGGVGPLQIESVIGVLKAYATRVGSGPLPTELNDEIGEHMVTVGREFGTTTGRRRRCGWLDLVPLRYASRVNSVTSLMLNKLDILSGIPELKVCVGYDIDGRLVSDGSLSAADLDKAQPIYETLPGWDDDLRKVKTYSALPKAARRYMAMIEEHAGVPDRHLERRSRAQPDAGSRRRARARRATGRRDDACAGRGFWRAGARDLLAPRFGGRRGARRAGKPAAWPMSLTFAQMSALAIWMRWSGCLFRSASTS